MAADHKALKTLVEEAVRALRTQQAVADAIGISTGRVGRIRKGEHSLDVLNCLKLAGVIRRNPSDVLRAAGKAEVAEAIEATYGVGQVTLTPVERAVLQQWSRVPDASKSTVSEVIERFAALQDKNVEGEPPQPRAAVGERRTGPRKAARSR